jgi:hypothetical protein
LLGVGDGESCHEVVGRVCVMGHLPANTFEVLRAVLGESLVDNVAVTHEDEAVEHGERL